MPKLSKTFATATAISWILGFRELWLAASFMILPPEAFQEFVTEKGLSVAGFEVFFLIQGGLFLVSWPIAYRRLQWRAK